MRPSLASTVVATIAAAACAAAPVAALAAQAPTAARVRSAATHLKRVHPQTPVRVSVLLRIDRAGVRARLASGRRAHLDAIIRRHHADDAAISVVRRWARDHGLRAEVGRMRTRVVVSGPATRIERAFGARLHVVRPGRGAPQVVASQPVAVPAPLQAVSEGLAGLEPEPPPTSAPVTSVPAAAPAPSRPGCQSAAQVPMAFPDGSVASPFTPTGIAARYGLDGIGDGTANPPQTLAIVEFDQQYSPSDVALYQQYCATSPPGSVTVRQMNLPGAQTTPGVEAQLDAQLVAGLAPANTTVVVVNVSGASITGWADALEAIAGLPNLTVVSASYGASETCETMGQCDSMPGVRAAESEFEALAASGVTIAVSAGDQGSMGPPSDVCAADFPGYGLPGQASVNYPASSLGVTAVGGTMWPTVDATGAQAVWNEPAGGLVQWACGVSGTGGGQSVLFPRPSWQPGISAIAGGMRLVPDVSLLAGRPGYLTLSGGAPGVSEGTSASAPLLGSAVLRINADRMAAGRRPVGFLQPALYAALAPSGMAITDLTTGTNDIFGNGVCCTAGPGFDMASGLGVPSFAAWPALLP